MDKTMQHKIDLLQHIWAMIDYWEKLPDQDIRSKLQGVAFSILVAIDGEAKDIGPYSLKPLLPDSKWGPDIGGDLHDLFYKLKKPA